LGGCASFQEGLLDTFNRLNKVRIDCYKSDRRYSPVTITNQGHVLGDVMWTNIPADITTQGIADEYPISQDKRVRVIPVGIDESQRRRTTPQVRETQNSHTEIETQSTTDDNNAEEQVAEVDGGSVLDEGRSYAVGEEEGVEADTTRRQS